MTAPMSDNAPVPAAYVGKDTEMDAAFLGENITCGTIVIGAGVTGSSVAYHLAKSGHDVVVVEEGSIGSGGSGRAFGNVVSFGKHPDAWVRRRYGAQGDPILAWLASGPDLVFDLIAEHGIDCEARRTGLLFTAHCDKAAVPLRERVNGLAARGLKVSYLEEDETAGIVGSEFYCGAMLDHNAGSINPLAYTRGLASAAKRAGAAIFQNSAALRIEKTSTGWTVSTAGGTVSARSIAICTNAYTGDLWPGLVDSIVPTRAYAVVSKPLDENIRHKILPQGQSLTDTRRLFSGIRLLDDGRVHLSVNGPAFDPGGQADFAGANQRIKELFPNFPPIDWEDSWTGWVAINMSKEPKLHRLQDGIWAAIGFSGRGLAFGTLMGRDIANRVVGREHEAVFPTSALRPLIGKRFAPLAVNTILKYYAWLDEKELDERRRTLAERA